MKNLRKFKIDKSGKSEAFFLKKKIISPWIKKPLMSYKDIL